MNPKPPAQGSFGDSDSPAPYDPALSSPRAKKSSVTLKAPTSKGHYLSAEARGSMRVRGHTVRPCLKKTPPKTQTQTNKKDTVSRVKRLSTDGEKIFINPDKNI